MRCRCRLLRLIIKQRRRIRRICLNAETPSRKQHVIPAKHECSQDLWLGILVSRLIMIMPAASVSTVCIMYSYCLISSLLEIFQLSDWGHRLMLLSSVFIGWAKFEVTPMFTTHALRCCCVAVMSKAEKYRRQMSVSREIPMLIELGWWSIRSSSVYMGPQYVFSQCYWQGLKA